MILVARIGKRHGCQFGDMNNLKTLEGSVYEAGSCLSIRGVSEVSLLS